MVPEIGITGTPVIDTTTNTMYLVAITKQYDMQTQITTFYQTLHALDIRNGVDKSPPHVIAATAHGNGTGSVMSPPWVSGSVTPVTVARLRSSIARRGRAVIGRSY